MNPMQAPNTGVGRGMTVAGRISLVGGGVEFGVWKPIEKAPKDGTRILCSYRGNRPFIARWRKDFSVFMDDWDSWRDATHWMHLPLSPKI